VQLKGLSRDKIRSFNHLLALALTAEPVGLFKPFISTITKAAAPTYFSSIKTPLLFQELFSMAEAPLREQLTAERIGQHYSTIWGYRASIFRQQPLDLPLAGEAESCARTIPELLGLSKQAEPLQTLMMSILPGTLWEGSWLARAALFFGQQMVVSHRQLQHRRRPQPLPPQQRRV
jgi:hypothetical protein